MGVFILCKAPLNSLSLVRVLTLSRHPFFTKPLKGPPRLVQVYGIYLV
jgi:hypothetical protein